MLSKNPLFLRMLMISTTNCPKIHKLKELKIKQIQIKININKIFNKKKNK